MQVRIGNNIEIRLPQNSYTNCHEFTRAVILELDKGRHLNNRGQNIALLLRAQNNPDTNQILEVYNSMKPPVNVGAIQFDKGALPIPVPSLIMFTLSGQISHSMIAIGTNSWQGANNLGSLGAPDAEVQIYPNISEWKYQKAKSGGWDDQNQMRSLYQDQYVMFYIPL